MPFLKGETLENKRLPAASRVGMDPNGVADVFAFMHWIGDEDRGLSDVMLVGGKFILIDNGLCGPGQSDQLRGYHPWPQTYSDEQIVKKCYFRKPSLVAFVLRDTELPHHLFASPPVLERIPQIPEDVVREVVRSVGIPDPVAESLIARKATIEADYQQWFMRATQLFKPQ